RYIAFYSTATNLVAGVTNTAGEIFVRDLVGGITFWASTNAQAIVQSNLHGNASSFNHVISANGQFVAFESTTNPPSKLARGLALRYDIQSDQTDLIHTNVYVPRSLFQDANNLAM